MATISMDPTFTKAYRLMFSNEPDSAEQMRAMLDDALKQKYGTHKTLTSVLPKKLMLEEPIIKDQPCSPSSGENIEDVDSEESNNSPENELSELNILEEDLLCVVCRQMMQSDGNRLVECQECHGLYHQECHQPPINETINDPRLAWYCAACKKKLNKVISSLKNNKPVPAAPVAATATAPVSPKPTLPSGKPPFTSSKTYSSSAAKSSNAPSKSSAKASSSSSSSGAASSASKSSKPSTQNKVPIQNMNMITADKRLQMMKKKAAAANKNQDKKK